MSDVAMARASFRIMRFVVATIYALVVFVTLRWAFSAPTWAAAGIAYLGWAIPNTVHVAPLTGDETL